MYSKYEYKVLNIGIKALAVARCIIELPATGLL
jgi:hypothetical protein